MAEEAGNEQILDPGRIAEGRREEALGTYFFAPLSGPAMGISI